MKSRARRTSPRVTGGYSSWASQWSRGTRKERFRNLRTRDALDKKMYLLGFHPFLLSIFGVSVVETWRLWHVRADTWFWRRHITVSETRSWELDLCLSSFRSARAESDILKKSSGRKCFPFRYTVEPRLLHIVGRPMSYAISEVMK